MSLTVCLPDLIAQGAIPAEKAQRVREFYDQRVAEYHRDMSVAAAEAKATEDAIAWLSAETLQKTRQRALQVKAQSQWLAEMKLAAPDGPISGKAAFERMARIDKRADAIRGRFFAGNEKFLADHRRNLFGQIRHKSDLDDIGRAMSGEKVDSLNARETADALAQSVEIARQRYNAAGGHIGKMENYIPQSHDGRLIRQAGMAEKGRFDVEAAWRAWREFPAVDRVRVMDFETGEVATGLRRETILRAIFDTLRSEGMSKAKPGQVFAGAMANRRADPRQLHFANFDDWIAYQRRFGGNDNLYDIIVGHLGGMARDIALMEDLGPNPAASLRFQQDMLKKSILTKGNEREIGKVEGRTKALQRLYDELTGGNARPENRRIALGFSAFRAQQTSAKLGSAMLSAVTDFATLLDTARFNDVPAMRSLARYAKLWNPLDDGDRRLAVRLGLVTDDWLNLSSASHRYLGEELTGEISRRMASFVIRAQGLARHTRNGQWAFGMEFLSMLTHVKDRGFQQLDPALIKSMKRYGIGEAQWDAYRRTPVRYERGSDWIFPFDADGKIGDRFLEMVLGETDYAVIVPDVRTRQFMHSTLPSGTIIGELGRSAFLFKGFPLAMINLHGRRTLAEGMGASSALVAGGLMAQYGLTLFLMMQVGGALSAQLKTVAAGKDPMPMDNAKFWGRAVAQSGGMGLFGDLLFNSENSYGGGILQTLAGPVLGQTVPNAVDATVGNALRAAGVGEGEPEFVKDIAKTAEKEIPGRNLWPTRMLWERWIADTIREWTDPEAAKAMRRMKTRARNEGTEYYWEPGEALPARAPDLENATEGELPQ